MNHVGLCTCTIRQDSQVSKFASASGAGTRKQIGLFGSLPWSGGAHAARLSISSTSERQARLGGACLYRPEHGSLLGIGEFLTSLDPVDTGIQIPNWVRLRPYDA
jgi:hypothetical protein